MEKNTRNIEPITENAQEMYNQYRIGHYSYGNKRIKYDPLLLRFLNQITNDKMLYDIGCGTGFWLDAYTQFGIKKTNIVGVDIAPKNIADIKAKGFAAQVGNVLDLDLPDHVADFTISNGVIHHTANPAKAFQELVRITKPGGKIYLGVYNKWNPYYYIVHRAMYPLRSYYWNRNKNIINYILPICKPIMQLFSQIIFRESLDDATAKSIFMDQVMTPRADLFSKKDLRDLAKNNHCEIEAIKTIKLFLMWGVIFQKRG